MTSLRRTRQSWAIRAEILAETSIANRKRRSSGKQVIWLTYNRRAVNEIPRELIEIETAIIVPQMAARSAKHNRKSDEGTFPQKWHVARREVVVAS